MPQRRSLAISSSTLLALLLAAAAARAQSPDTPEPGSGEAIAAATTEPRFLSPWVADVPQAGIPSPTEHLGHIVGAPGELSRTAKIYALLPRAGRGHDRACGWSRSARPRRAARSCSWSWATTTSLARARPPPRRHGRPGRSAPHRRGGRWSGSSPRTKPFYMLHGGLHSTETGSPEMLMELAYRLAVSEAPHIRADPRPRRSSSSTPWPSPTAATARWTGSTAT